MGQHAMLSDSDFQKLLRIASFGKLYESRFGAVVECLALWDRAAAAFAWGETFALGAFHRPQAKACLRIGIGLVT